MKKQFLKRAGALFLAAALVVGAVQIPALSTKAAWTWNAQTSESGYSKVPVSDISVTADSAATTTDEGQNGGLVEYAIDGKVETYWHSNYKGNNNPVQEDRDLIANNTITLTLNNPQNIAGVTYLPRQDVPANGVWLRFEVGVQKEGSDTYVTVYSQNEDMSWGTQGNSWPEGTNAEREFIFADVQKNVRKIRFTITRTDGQNGDSNDYKYINAAELSVLKEMELAEIDRTVLEKYAKASSEDNNGSDGPASYAFNGDDSNWWHSNWSNYDGTGNVSEENPIWIQTGFGQVKTIGAIQYQARGNNHNIIKDYKISVANIENPTENKPSEDQWVEIQTGEFAATNDMQTVKLDKAVAATHIRLTATSFTATDGNTDAHIAAKHIKIYEVTDKNVQGIQLASQPTKTNYMIGDDFDPAGMVVKKVYEGGALGLDNIADDVVITGYDKTKLGSQEITVSYNGLEEKFNVNVGIKTEMIDNAVLRAKAKANSEQIPAQNVNDGGAEWAFNGNPGNWWHSRYSGDKGENEVSSGEASENNPIWIQTGFDECRKIVGIIYQGRSSGDNIIGNYEILAANLENPKGTPEDTDFNKSAATGTFIATGNPQPVNFEAVDATHLRLVAKSAVGNNGALVTAANIQVLALIEDVACIRLTPPAKTEYLVGEELDTTGMKVEAIYGNGNAEDVDLNDVTISKFVSQKVGKQTITVTYSPEEGESYTESFDVTVSKAEDVKDGLVGYYTFDDEDPSSAFANMAETDEKLADAVITGATANDDAISGKSVSFTNDNVNAASSYLTISEAFSTNVPTTISFWLKASDVLKGIVAKVSVFHEMKGRAVATYNSDVGVGTFLSNNQINIDEVMPVGQWYHVVEVIDSDNSSVHFYVNGKKVKTQTGWKADLSNTDSDLRIGAHKGSNNSNYNGLLDNVRIYNRALSAIEAASIYEVEKPYEEPDAVKILPEEITFTSLDQEEILTVGVEPQGASEPVSCKWETDSSAIVVEDSDVDNTAVVRAVQEGTHTATIKLTATMADDTELTAEREVTVDIEPAFKTTVIAEVDAESQDMGTVMITANGEPIESGTVVGADVAVVMTAAAKDGYRFVEWENEEGDLVTRDAILNITTGSEDGTVKYYAHFKPVVSDTENVAAGKNVTGVNGLTAASGTSFSVITDGVKDLNQYADFAVYDESGQTTIDASAAIQIDLGKKYNNIDYLRMIRYYYNGRIYKGTVIVISDDAAMKENANVIYNSDAENVHKLGAGTETTYAEAQDGRVFVVPEGISGRYVTVYMHGSAANNSNHIIEVEVYAPETDEYDPNVQTQYWDHEQKNGTLGQQTEDDVWHYQAHSTENGWIDMAEDDFTKDGDDGHGIWGSDGSSSNATYSWGAIWRTKLTPCLGSTGYDAVAYGWKAPKAGYVKLSLAGNVSLNSSAEKEDVTMKFVKGTASEDTDELFGTTIVKGSQDVDVSSYTATVKVEAGDYLRVAAYAANNDLLNVQPVVAYVDAPEHILDSIEITSKPTKTTYQEGEDLNLEGMVVTATYEDGATLDVTDKVTTEGYDKNVVGKQTVKVKYTENDVTKEAEFEVEVQEKQPEGPVITAEPDEDSKNMGTAAITVNGQEAASGSAIKAGDKIVMTAAPKDGYRFVEWRNAQGKVETRDAVLSVTIGEEAESAAYYAHFKAAVSGAVNVALNKTVTGVDGLEPESDPSDSSKYAFGRVTDGSLDGFTAFSKTKADGSGDSAAIQIDLGKKYENLDYIKMVRYYSDGRTYNGTAIVISDDPEMSQNAKVIYNSDHANLHNKGVGTEALYAETAQGHEFVIPEGVSGRYVTIYMCGNTQASGANPSNHIIEIEVYAPETQQSGGNTDELKKEVALAETLSEQIKDDPMYADDVKAALTQAIEAAQALLAQEEAGEEVTDEAIAAALAELEKAYQDAYLGQDAGDYNPNVQTEYWDAEKNANTLGDQTEGDVWHYQVQDTAGVWSDIPTESFTASGDSGNGIWGSDGATADATYSWGAIWRSKLVPCLGDGGYNAVAYGWKASKDGYVKISLAKALNLHTDSGKDNITFSYTKGTATADEQELFSETLTAGSQDIAVDSYTAITKVTAGDYLRIAAYFANNDLVNVEPVITYITAREYAQEYLEQVGGISLEDKTEESAAAFTAAKDALDKAVKDETSTSAKLGELIEALETAVAGLTQAESPKTLESITVTPPTKTTYKVGDTLDTAGMKVTANYSDGSTEDVTSAATLSGFDSASAGTKTVTVTYEGKTATFTVTVEEEGTTPPPAEKTLESIEVTPPTKTTYKVGEELDKTGLKVTAKYSDGSTEDVTDQAVLSEFDPAAEGEQTITVTYEGKTAEFTVTVEKEGSEEPPVEKPLLRSITVTPPAKTVYKAGEALDLTGMKVTAAYSDGTTVDVTADAIVSGYDPNKAGTQTITVSYNGKTVTFTITVEDGQTPVVTPPETQTPQGDGNGNSPAVATGDNTPIGLMMTMMLLAAGVIVMTRKKRAM